jgi:hypothetical protein
MLLAWCQTSPRCTLHSANKQNHRVQHPLVEVVGRAEAPSDPLCDHAVKLGVLRLQRQVVASLSQGALRTLRSADAKTPPS